MHADRTAGRSGVISLETKQRARRNKCFTRSGWKIRCNEGIAVAVGDKK
jgi:hypothetical protein